MSILWSLLTLLLTLIRFHFLHISEISQLARSLSLLTALWIYGLNQKSYICSVCFVSTKYSYTLWRSIGKFIYCYDNELKMWIYLFLFLRMNNNLPSPPTNSKKIWSNKLPLPKHERYYTILNPKFDSAPGVYQMLLMRL